MTGKRCPRKIRFPRPWDAQGALQRIVAKGRAGKPNRAYRCPHCDGYHLTAKPLRGGGRDSAMAGFLPRFTLPGHEEGNPASGEPNAEPEGRSA